MLNNERIKAIDDLRGFAVIAMILVNYLGFYDQVPPYLKHAPGIGIRPADLVAPVFMFVLGLLYRRSLLHRITVEGRASAWLHFGKRYLALLLIGTIGGAIAKGGLVFDWGVLQTIGLAGILGLPLIESRPLVRVATAAILLAVYQIFLLPNLGKLILLQDHGGPWAVISWLNIIILATVIGDAIDFRKIHQCLKRLSAYGLILTGLGLALAVYLPINKHEVSSSYIITATGLAVILFTLFIISSDIIKLPLPSLQLFGQNALLVFLLHYLLIRIGHHLIPPDSNLILVIFGMAGIFLTSYFFVWYLNFKKIRFKL